jgi:TatD DNase family protein
VHTIINIGADRDSSENAVTLANRFDGCYAAVGVHPHDAETLNPSIVGELRDWASHDKVVAIGEIGLDYYRDLSPRDVQKKAFRQQLELAIDVSLPIVIHTRDSFRDTVEIVRDYARDLRGGVFHCFQGNADDAAEVIALGFHISVGGIITFGDTDQAKTAAATRLEKILIETDAPYLTPVPHRGKQNRPAYVTHVCTHLAKLQNTTPGEVEKVTDRTVQKLFRLVDIIEG